ncbi:hypothetical protein M6B38_319635 [Iris pallida]|uniref:Uncharacterized protein n=1 Tax=Iris pallida TaxID=29817 RepID=A0AAX6F7T6_IRIPA|nr:hypothetical protein M6B38_194610 [Iris pallida]KAJ6812406.1 hypothetical protein M6B38_149080 [Iris pallida]KAJ6831447.1 hypothetical protein M6B38_348980 [Iris pallida]KAJ6838860.1 hypothetical protein M6B38_319635 [Iris pallida]
MPMVSNSSSVTFLPRSTGDS